MSRYENTKKIKRMMSKLTYYQTTYYKEIPTRNDDMYFIAQEGDRCDNLAYRFYGSPELWWFIARVNNLSANNIPAGTSLRIPRKLEDAEGF
tara:strand:- start:3414 stop:3689 length:276 start_codon:yes stop_codon:yes gene_type:complete